MKIRKVRSKNSKIRSDFGKCKKHGYLNDENSIKENCKGKIRLRCKECRNVAQILQKCHKKIIECKHHGKLKLEDVSSRNRCRICTREYNKTRDKEKRNEYERQLYKKNIEAQKTRGQIKNKNLTREEYFQMIIDQDNKCAICKKSETRIGRDKVTITRLAIDHDHITGKVRKLLCSDCNTGLGKFKDSITLLQKTIDYLREHNTDDYLGSTKRK